MIVDFVMDLVPAFCVTVAFSVLLQIPKKYYFYCGLNGMIGWIVYYIVAYQNLEVTAIFFATVTVVILARILAIYQKCPITIFLIPGIVPIVPGVKVFYTAYYMITDEFASAAEYGIDAIKMMFSMVIGIVIVFSLPTSWFAGKLQK